ncbi:MAG: hypothetical protein JWO95_507 [Verrucomicrobiales bacterium]|nr:hypothetical protein [Verrucomicrobiales bacterium]
MWSNDLVTPAYTFPIPRQGAQNLGVWPDSVKVLYRDFCTGKRKLNEDL